MKRPFTVFAAVIVAHLVGAPTALAAALITAGCVLALHRLESAA